MTLALTDVFIVTLSGNGPFLFSGIKSMTRSANTCSIRTLFRHQLQSCSTASIRNSCRYSLLIRNK